MFAHVLAMLLGASSFIFYMAAFFYPEVHRRSDIWLSGLGLIYAAVLWLGAAQMTVTVLLGQTVAIALLILLGWQTLSIRREKTPVYQQTPVVLTPEVVGSWAKNTINQLRIAPDNTLRPLRPQNPSLNATSAERFTQTLDPRRRPVYDYEFVEDGIVADEAVPVDVAVSWPETVEVPTDVVPPSAEAEVIEAIAPEADTAIEPNPSEPGSIEFDASEPESTEPESIGSDSTEPESSESDSTEPESSEPESTEPESTEPESPPAESVQPNSVGSPEEVSKADDWGLDDWTDEQSAQQPAAASDVSNRQPPTQEPAVRLAEKPSVFAIPVILIGWVKDVVVSLTRPKPTKPVIDIPRRDISAAQTGAPSIDASPSPAADYPQPDPAPGPSIEHKTPDSQGRTDDFPTDDDWEESNWDD